MFVMPPAERGNTESCPRDEAPFVSRENVALNALPVLAIGIIATTCKYPVVFTHANDAYHRIAPSEEEGPRMISLRLLSISLILCFCSLVWAQESGPLTLTGRLYQTNPASRPGGHIDYTARGMLTLNNKSAKKVKDLRVEAKYYSPEGKLLFTDTQSANVESRATADVYFAWSNPTYSKIDHVDVIVSGDVDKPFTTTITLRYDY